MSTNQLMNDVTPDVIELELARVEEDFNQAWLCVLTHVTPVAA